MACNHITFRALKITKFVYVLIVPLEELIAKCQKVQTVQGQKGGLCGVRMTLREGYLDKEIPKPEHKRQITAAGEQLSIHFSYFRPRVISIAIFQCAWLSLNCFCCGCINIYQQDAQK